MEAECVDRTGYPDDLEHPPDIFIIRENKGIQTKHGRSEHVIVDVIILPEDPRLEDDCKSNSEYES